MTQKAQRQDSLTRQLLDLIRLANEHGMYDAADWVRDRFAGPGGADPKETPDA